MKEDVFNYDSIAARYANKVDVAPYNALYERPAMLDLLPDVNGATVLDAGCGSGWYAERLLERGATVTAIDASMMMIEHARDRLARLSPDQHSRVAFAHADLNQPLAMSDGAFNGVLCPLVLHYVKDWRPMLRELHRVLRDRGWLLFSTHHPAVDAALTGTRNYFAIEHVKDNWEWVGDVEFYRRSLTEIMSAVLDSGFVIERCVEPTPSADLKASHPEIWDKLMAQPGFLMILARRG